MNDRDAAKASLGVTEVELELDNGRHATYVHTGGPLSDAELDRLRVKAQQLIASTDPNEH